MSLLHAACKLCLHRKLSNLTCCSRLIHASKVDFADVESNSKDNSNETFDILEELREPELTEEEILQKRFKARLPERVYRKFVLKQPVEIESKYDFEMKRLRSYYARFGRNSQLNPGICWPTREEVLETKEYDQMFEPPLEVRIKNVEEARLAEKERKCQVEAEVAKNMANLDKWMSDYYGKIEKKKEEQIALKKKKEKLIDEICEYLGYEIDPRDPRFQEAVEQRQKEEKKARKAKKQQENYEKMISKLKHMASEK